MKDTKTTAHSGIAQITNIELADIAIERAIGRTTNLPGLVVMHGPSGFGKSMSANYVANRRRAYYVQAKSAWTKKVFLQKVLFEMGIAPAKTIGEMLDQICDQLAASSRPLMIDEADHIVEKNYIELVRDIYESSQAPIMLIGEEGLPQKLKRFERFHGRVLTWIAAQPVTLADAKLLQPIYSPQVKVANDLLQRLVDLAHGSVRRVCVNLDNIQEEALKAGLDEIDLAAWGKRALFTGEAPNRRV